MRIVAVLLVLAFNFHSVAQITPSAYQDLKYRMIGPFRAGRTVGAVGVPSQPHVFFIGVNNGGVWKTTDYGRTWNPIFDKAPTGSVGDLAVSLPIRILSMLAQGKASTALTSQWVMGYSNRQTAGKTGNTSDLMIYSR